MTDVTLISEDKKQFKAHKVVLSASSPVFKNIITGCSLSNPLIYLRGIQSFEIESILQFIYLGEAKFYQDRMNEFINVAKSLEIKEISIDEDNPEKRVELKKLKLRILKLTKPKFLMVMIMKSLLQMIQVFLAINVTNILHGKIAIVDMSGLIKVLSIHVLNVNIRQHSHPIFKDI